MKTKILSVVIILFVTLFINCTNAQTSASDNFSGLEGKSCVIHLINKINLTDKRTDLLSFSYDGIGSETCRNEGMDLYSKEIYSSDGKKVFTFEYRSENNKKIMLQGELVGNKLIGTYTLTVGNRKPVEYLFSGVID